MNLQKRVIFFPYLIISLAVIGCMVLLPIQGQYVLNDSYVYAHNVINFLNGNFFLRELTGPTNILTTVFGALISKLFGYSPTLLRITSAFFSLFGLLIFIKLLKQEKISQTVAVFGALLLFFNPFYFYSSFSFMTEISFLVTALASIHFYQQGIIQNKLKPLIWGSFFASLSFLSRQQGILLVPSALISLWMKNKNITTKNIKKSLAIFLLPLIALLWYQFFFSPPSGHSFFNLQKGLLFLNTPGRALNSAIQRIAKSTYYAGILIAPIIIASAWSHRKQLFSKKAFKYFSISFLMLSSFSVYLWLKNQQLMFYIPNIITYAGFIPSELGGGDYIKQTIFVNCPVTVKGLLTLLSTSLSSTAVALISLQKRNLRGASILTFFTILNALLLFPFKNFYDRYLLVFIPFLIILFLKFVDLKKSSAVAWVSLTLYALVSFGFEYDYLALNKKIGQLVKKYGKNVTFSTFSLNGYYHLDRTKNLSNKELFENRTWRLKKENSKYMIAYQPDKEWALVEETEYSTPLGKNFQIPLFVMKNKKN